MKHLRLSVPREKRSVLHDPVEVEPVQGEPLLVFLTINSYIIEGVVSTGSSGRYTIRSMIRTPVPLGPIRILIPFNYSLTQV